MTLTTSPISRLLWPSRVTVSLVAVRDLDGLARDLRRLVARSARSRGCDAPICSAPAATDWTLRDTSSAAADTTSACALACSADAAIAVATSATMALPRPSAAAVRPSACTVERTPSCARPSARAMSPSSSRAGDGGVDGEVALGHRLERAGDRGERPDDRAHDRDGHAER